MNKATPKQVAYALRLMDLAGFSTTWMQSKHKLLGATMRERSGRVEDWLASKSRHEMSKLLDRLEELASTCSINQTSPDGVSV